jgi:tRNA1(Val) A37 N6-methylase TrmN6
MLTASMIRWIRFDLRVGAAARARNAAETLMSETPVTVDAFLGGRVTVAQPARGYRAGLDAILLAATVVVDSDASATMLDLGAGVGTVGLCVATRNAAIEVTLLEVQPELVALAAENIRRNHLEQRVRVITADVHDSPEQLSALGVSPDRFDHVICNPPFDIEGHGRSPPNALKARSHVMPVGELEHWGRVLARYCRASGTVTMIHRADALGAVLAQRTSLCVVPRAVVRRCRCSLGWCCIRPTDMALRTKCKRSCVRVRRLDFEAVAHSDDPRRMGRHALHTGNPVLPVLGCKPHVAI